MGGEIRRKYGVRRRYFCLGPPFTIFFWFFSPAKTAPLNFFVSAFPSRIISASILDVVLGVRPKSFAISFLVFQPSGITSSPLVEIYFSSALTQPLIKMFSCLLARWIFRCAPLLETHRGRVRESIRKPSRVASVVSASGLGCRKESCCNSIQCCTPLGCLGSRS